MAPFAGDLAERFRAVRALEKELASLRQALVDELYEMVPKTEPEGRAFLLTVKRDSYNGRPLATHREHPAWPDLVRRRPLAGQVLEREERLRRSYEELEDAWQAQRLAELDHLVDVSRDPRLLRGLALASPILSRQLTRRRHRLARDEDRKTTKLAESLLRYASRAALKLSPYATFTRVAPISIRSEGELQGLRFPDRPWRERSLVRFKRYLMEQEQEMLSRCPAIRDRLPVRLNPTLVETANGRRRWLRPDRWELDEANGKMRHRSLDLVGVKLPPSLVEWLRTELRGGPRPYGELLRLVEDLSGEERSTGRQTLDRLLALGFLEIEPLLRPEHLHPERALTRALTDLGETEAAPVISRLEQLTELQDGYAAADDPDHVITELHRIWNELWHATTELAAAPTGTERHQPKKDDLFQDVFLEAGPDGVLGVVEMSEATATELFHSVQPWYQLGRLRGLRLDLLHTMSAFLRQRAGRDGMGVLDFFVEFRDLWRQYRDAEAEGASSYNPLDLDEVSELARARDLLPQRLSECMRPGPEGIRRISRRRLEALLADLPELAGPRDLGPCLFVQPTDPGAEQWVLNRVFEGTGRYGSRFTPVMGEVVRRRYVDRLTEGSTVQVDGESWELLDLLCPHGDTLNVHAPQTRKILRLPGQPLDLPPERLVDLTRLRLRVDPHGWPTLMDLEGRRWLPVHLGGAATTFLPSLLRLLAHLGPAETLPPALSPAPRAREGVDHFDRLVLDRLVLRRRRWRVTDPEPLKEIFTRSESRAFFDFQAWRLDQDLPDRVFVLEKVHHPSVSEMYKPQYLELTSPSFVFILSGIVGSGQAPLVFEEALPEPRHSPVDATGTPWATEVMLDAHVFRPGGPAADSASTGPPDRAELSHAGEPF